MHALGILLESTMAKCRRKSTINPGDLTPLNMCVYMHTYTHMYAYIYVYVFECVFSSKVIK